MRKVLTPEQKKQHVLARSEMGKAIRSGVLQSAGQFTCVDCGQPATQYDHYLGYDELHFLDVQPVCLKCHWARTNAAYDGVPSLPRATVRWQPRATRLKEIRTQQAMKQWELATRAGVKLETVARIEGGSRTTIPILRKLAAALGVEPAALLAAPKGEG